MKQMFSKSPIIGLIVSLVIQVAAAAVLILLLGVTYAAPTFAKSKTDAPEEAELADSDSSGSDAWEFLLDPNRDYGRTVANTYTPYVFGGVYDRALQPDLVCVMDDVYMDRFNDLGELSTLDSAEALALNSVRVEKAAYFAYTRLKAELKADYDIDIGLLGSTAGYRLPVEQQAIFEVYGGVLPGFSDHHTGLTLSVVFLVPGKDGTSTAVVPTPEFAGKHRDLMDPFLDLLPENGFVVRFPPGKEPLTGVPGTYRDIRFVGSSRLAKTLTATDACLEEYVAGSSGS